MKIIIIVSFMENFRINKFFFLGCKLPKKCDVKSGTPPTVLQYSNRISETLGHWQCDLFYLWKGMHATKVYIGWWKVCVAHLYSKFFNVNDQNCYENIDGWKRNCVALFNFIGVDFLAQTAYSPVHVEILLVCWAFFYFGEPKEATDLGLRINWVLKYRIAFPISQIWCNRVRHVGYCDA